MKGGVERRAVALDSSIENVLIEAGVRAAEQLKSSRPKLSAATLNKLTNAIPLLFGVLAFVAMCTTSGMNRAFCNCGSANSIPDLGRRTPGGNVFEHKSKSVLSRRIG